MILGPGEAVLELVRIHRMEADIIERRLPDEAAMMRKLVDEYEECVTKRLPEWVDLAEVVAWTGWSDRKIRDLAKEWQRTDRSRPEPERRVRKAAGRWQMRRTAARAIEARPAHQARLDSFDDLMALAERLGTE